MPNGKIQSESHLIDKKAIQILENIFPIEWIKRTMSPDYGIDIDLELFDKENGKCITLGEHLFLQIKGTKAPKYKEIYPFGIFKELSSTFKINTIAFPIEISLLNLVERMGSSIPVLLIVVDITTNKAYFVCLNDYIQFVLPYQQPNYKKQKSVTIYLPIDNELSQNQASACKWYAKRSKIYALFNDMFLAFNDFEYLSIENKVIRIKRLIDNIIESDAWSAKSHWPALQDLYNMYIETYNNQMTNSDGKRFVLSSVERLQKEYDEKMEYINFNGIDMSVQVALQMASCNSLIVFSKACFDSLHGNIRQFSLPTSQNYLSK